MTVMLDPVQFCTSHGLRVPALVDPALAPADIPGDGPLVSKEARAFSRAVNGRETTEIMRKELADILTSFRRSLGEWYNVKIVEDEGFACGNVFVDIFHDDGTSVKWRGRSRLSYMPPDGWTLQNEAFVQDKTTGEWRVWEPKASSVGQNME